MSLITKDALQANLGFVVAQTAHVEVEVYKARYPSIRYPGLIPIDNSAHEWAKSVEYFSSDVSGEASWLADRAADIPVVATAYGVNVTPVHMAGIGYDYGIEEVNQAFMLGINLAGDKAEAARMIYERTVDDIAFTGDTTKKMEGLFNHSSVAASSAVTGDWQGGTTTPDQILADVNALLTGVFTETNTIAIADTLLLPSTAFQFIASARLTDTALTIFEFLQRANSYTAETGLPLTIRGMRGLENAGGGSTRRMVAYRNHRQVLRLHIPMRHRFLPVQIVGLTYKVPGIFRLGGLDIRLPKEVRYADGI